MNHEKETPHQHQHGAGDHCVKDPVCGMEVNPESAAASIEHGGHTYYFCGAHCQEKFRADPARYAAAKHGC